MKRLIIMLAIAMCFAGVAWGGTPDNKIEIYDSVVYEGTYTTALTDAMLTIDDMEADYGLVVDGDVEITGNLILPNNRSLIFCGDGTYQWSVDADEEKGVDMFEIWETGVFFSWWLFGGLSALFLLVEMFWFAFQWVNDKEDKEALLLRFIPDYKKNFYGPIPILLALLAVVVGMFLGLIWPITHFLILSWGILFVLRGCLRFKKKVNSALSMKSDKGHSHPEYVEE